MMRIMLSALLLLAQQPSLPWPDLEKAVVYEANFRAMSPEGGFKGVTQRLDHIKSLGVNVLWLMPVHPVGKTRSAGGLGSPYSISDYKTVNPELGTEEDFRELVREAKSRDMAVILDWVANHTSWDNPWLQNPGWYTTGPDGKPTVPGGTNWNDVADLNFDSQPMREAMIDSMEFWVIRYGIDGFRCDYADGVPADFWKVATTRLEKTAGRPLFLLAEGARQDHHESGFDITFDWPGYGLVKEVFGGTKSAREYVPGVQGRRLSLRWVTNHDQYAWENSVVDVFPGEDAAFGAFVATAMTDGVPLIYSGQELAWPEPIPFFTRSSLDWNANPENVDRMRRFMQAREEELPFGPAVDLSTDKVIALRRGGLTVAVNTSESPQEVAVEAGTYEDLLTGSAVEVRGPVKLGAYETRVLRIR